MLGERYRLFEDVYTLMANSHKGNSRPLTKQEILARVKCSPETAGRQLNILIKWNEITKYELIIPQTSIKIVLFSRKV